MKQVCLQCGRVSGGGDLFCQETYCPCEMSPTILDTGDWFGDIEVVKPIIVLRSAALYEATHQKKKVYMKVAHPGAENKERLKREAEFLQSLQLRKLDQATLPKEFNFLADYHKPGLHFDADHGFSFDGRAGFVRPYLVHVYHHWGDRDWAVWRWLESRIGALTGEPGE